MGGATSKLSENVWEKADGKLADPEDTIDGAPPTTEYKVFHLTKRGVNQRDFDITDDESNLLYTTRQVPGTIACFDVLGKEIDNYLLRVEVDVARRYWTIYRYDEMAFDDQSPDKAATERLAAERLKQAEKEPMVDNFRTPFLFRKACIVVSWSRYMAVTMLYGPPSEEMVKSFEDELFALESQASGISDVGANDESLSGEKPEIAAKSEDEHSTGGEELNGEELNEVPLDKQSSNVSAASSGVSFEDVEIDTENDVVRARTGSAQDLAEKAGDEGAENVGIESERLENTDSEAPKVPSKTSSFPRLTSEARRKKFREWARQKSKHISERTRTALEKSGFISNKSSAKRDPMEGVLHLHQKPLLLCQEIYNRIIGNHQTSLITKEKALELMKQDIAQHEKEHPDTAKEDEEHDPILTGQEVILRTKSMESQDEEIFDPDKDLNGEATDDKKSEGEEQEKGAEGNADEAGKEPAERTDQSSTEEYWLGGSNPDDGNSKRDEAEEEEEKEQPLVGYWLWENTLRTHKMKMHVAKGTDLALHVVMAILVNQVRYERNALAMTV